MTFTTEDDRVDRLYHATRTPRLVVVPPLTFLCVDGHGDPNRTPAYAEAVQALYSVSYAARFAVRKAGGPDTKVSVLEGLWWAEDAGAFEAGDKSTWDWTAMIRQPDAVTADLCDRLVEEVASHRSMPAARRLRLTSIEEGHAAQLLHVGPYSQEAPTILRLHEFIRDQGFSFDGRLHKHHEIYLSDPRRSAPERLRTIIRQPYAA